MPKQDRKLGRVRAVLARAKSERIRVLCIGESTTCSDGFQPAVGTGLKPQIGDALKRACARRYGLSGVGLSHVPPRSSALRIGFMPFSQFNGSSSNWENVNVADATFDPSDESYTNDYLPLALAATTAAGGMTLGIEHFAAVNTGNVLSGLRLVAPDADLALMQDDGDANYWEDTTLYNAASLPGGAANEFQRFHVATSIKTGAAGGVYNVYPYNGDNAGTTAGDYLTASPLTTITKVAPGSGVDPLAITSIALPSTHPCGILIRASDYNGAKAVNGLIASYFWADHEDEDGNPVPGFQFGNTHAYGGQTLDKFVADLVQPTQAAVIGAFNPHVIVICLDRNDSTEETGYLAHYAQLVELYERLHAICPDAEILKLSAGLSDAAGDALDFLLDYARSGSDASAVCEYLDALDLGQHIEDAGTGASEAGSDETFYDDDGGSPGSHFETPAFEPLVAVFDRLFFAEQGGSLAVSRSVARGPGRRRV